MYDIALSAATHDLLITDSQDLKLINDAERIAQQIKITLLAWLGEWFLDSRFGVPYLEKVLVKNPNMNHIRGILRQRVQDVPGVLNVVGLTARYDRQRRSMSVEYEAATMAGLITRKEVLQYGS